MSALSLPFGSRNTFLEEAKWRLQSLWLAIHGEACPAEVSSLLSTMLSSWGSFPVPDTPLWLSDIGNDHSPFEFSVALTPGVPELRFVVEAQGSRPGFGPTRDACLRLNDSLAKLGADFERFEQVRDLFLPDVTHARFALWHAVALAPGPLRAKAYLNPQIRGADGAAALAQSAFERLDIGDAWPTVALALPGRPLRGEEIRYVALDLDRSQAARVKVYLYMEGVSARDLERLAALRPGYAAGEVADFCQAITGSTGPYRSRPPCVYLAFVGNDPVPSDVTVQIPISYYTLNDRIARDRVRAYLHRRGLDPTRYETALEAIAVRSLDSGSGLHTYISLRTGTNPARVTTYFAAELYGPHVDGLANSPRPTRVTNGGNLISFRDGISRRSQY